ncbi:hypothetical protein I6L35_09635 [Aeromonas sp. FDAARGOS 1405]|uniref:hypothetical protein n=1 Tax=unclassified Aeromonas TaxID=257493 RepID=UPI001C21D7AC|nr:hypothetical protein [Aeromonas sp. FDAARGOS 1405]QXB31367.1 hypothetical protein I6L35_09635 [Aeromonas sp. FDAARGOS 1405]
MKQIAAIPLSYNFPSFIDYDATTAWAGIAITVDGQIRKESLYFCSGLTIPDTVLGGTVTSEQKVEALEALLPLLVQVIAEGKLQQTALADLRANHAALQALSSSPAPNWSVIGALSSCVRSILEGAGGGGLAAQALGWLTTLTAG